MPAPFLSPGDAVQAVERGIAFLAATQLPSGQIPTYTGPDLRSGPVFDSSPFTTALVAHSIAGAPGSVAQSVRARALDFLVAEMESGGVWRYWASDHGGHHLIPPDVDDTACAAAVLRDHGHRVPDSRPALLANRDLRGRFFTWMVPHGRPTRPNRALRPVIERQDQERTFFADNAISADDVSCVVNANVLHFLGPGRAARPVVRYLTGVARRGEEIRGDSWYGNAFPFYYSVSRCIADGIRGLMPLAATIEARIAAAQRPDGRIGPSALETALAAGALRYLDRAPGTLTRACTYLLGAQSADGSWEIAPLYHGGPPDLLRWGSAELTTGFCLEALLPVAGSPRP